MHKNTSVTLGKHFEGFIAAKIKEGRFESKSEAVRAGMRLLEDHENKLETLRAHLAETEIQLDRGEGIDGEAFFAELLDEESK
ncbi:MAG: type II toxin-antitoxin system ParD family antitoxin [Chlorobi bacterium]|nr:type II toxin-antitoxin system ParD family antitoxin [Chlorobiota bacterium]